MTGVVGDPIGPYNKDAVQQGMAAPSVLNPLLYDRLQRQLGSVVIAKQGEAVFGGGYEYTAGRNRYKPLSSGEYYRVCCPFCLKRNAMDTRHRLWINHRWGVGMDPGTEFYDPNDRFWWMCVCYNESCLEDPENRKALRTMIYGGVGRELHGETVTIRQGSTALMSLGIVEFPGHCQRVDELPVVHRAWQYLLSRGMDPKQLGPQYDLSYCHESIMYPVVAGKLIIPIYMDSRMVGWQARPPYDIDWKAAGQPKYYNCPRTNKRLMLYGADAAKKLPFCIVVEGVTDVWAIGSGAVCVLGKDMSPVQGGLIGENWEAAVIALDGDAQERAIRMQDMLERGCNMRDKVVNVRLPEGLDPATTESDYFWDLVYGSAAAKGVDLSNP